MAIVPHWSLFMLLRACVGFSHPGNVHYFMVLFHCHHNLIINYNWWRLAFYFFDCNQNFPLPRDFCNCRCYWNGISWTFEEKNCCYCSRHLFCVWSSSSRNFSVLRSWLSDFSSHICSAGNFLHYILVVSFLSD